MPMPQQTSKVEGIYEIALSKNRKSQYYSIGALILLCVMLFSGVLLSTFEKNQSPIWELHPASQVLTLGVSFSPLGAVLLLLKSKNLSREKKDFINAYKAYKLLARYNNLKDCPSQLPSDVAKAKKYLIKLSLSFCDRQPSIAISDIAKQLNALYESIGKMVQTRIINKLSRKEELPLLEELAFSIAETLADNSFNKLQSLQDSLSALAGEGSEQSNSSFLSSHATIKKGLLYGGKLVVSILSVSTVAFVIASILQRNISEFGPYILASSFVLFVAWVFKTK